MTAQEAVFVDQENPDREALVRVRAYYLYLERERDGANGDEVADWLRAEEMELGSPAQAASTRGQKPSAQREGALKSDKPTSKGVRTAAGTVSAA